MSVLSEHAIEVRAELMMTALDRNFMNGNLTQKEYDDGVKELDDWTKKEYAKLKKRY